MYIGTQPALDRALYLSCCKRPNPRAQRNGPTPFLYRFDQDEIPHTSVLSLSEWLRISLERRDHARYFLPGHI